MWEEIWKAVSFSFLPATVKFVLGPLGGFSAGLHFVTSFVCTVAGMMTTVVAIVYSGNWFRDRVLNRLYPRRKRFSERNRKLVAVWNRYGLTGVAFLTPLLLTPVGGSLLAVSFGGPREKIVFQMAVSAVFWSLVFNGAVYFFGRQLPDLLDWFSGLIG